MKVDLPRLQKYLQSHDLAESDLGGPLTNLAAALDRLVREATAPGPTSPPMINDQGD